MRYAAPKMVNQMSAKRANSSVKENDLPNIPHVFISSIAQTGLQELKDIIWKALNE